MGVGADDAASALSDLCEEPKAEPNLDGRVQDLATNGDQETEKPEGDCL